MRKFALIHRLNYERFIKSISLLLMFLVISNACREKYVAKTSYPYTGYLVVEGFIDANGGSTTFKLSRTTTLDSAQFRAETGASVAVQSEGGENFDLSEQENGNYSASGIPIQQGSRYRLHIVAAGSQEYVSDYSAARITPPLDSVSWKEQNDGLQINVSSHDETKGSIYYKWRFDETWKYYAKYYAGLKWDPADPRQVDSFRYRRDDELIDVCWKSDTSSNIQLGSTAKLTSDVLAEQPVTFIAYSQPFNKLYYRYSIQVYLETLAEDEYDWYEKLRKNTESLGSIFDAQPSDLRGNVHRVNDATETVIGWVSCHTVSQQRIFISRVDLPHATRLDDGYGGCQLDTLIFGKDSDQIRALYSEEMYKLPLGYYTSRGSPKPTGVIGSFRDCADCRVKGGVLMKPDFWQD